MSYHPGKFNWFEHRSDDPVQARKFYESLFGWNVQPTTAGGHTYDVIHNGEEAIGSIRSAPAGASSLWNSFMSVTDLDSRFKAAIDAGAKPLMQPSDYPALGHAATLVDTAGAVVSLWRASDGDRPDAQHVAVGDWVWNELLTHDVKKALAFYESVFGYSHDMMPGAQGWEYFILKSADGKGRGGVMRAPHADTPPMWVPYVRAEDADGIAARAGPLGGKLMMAPTDVPGVGRIGSLFDPLGAALGFIRPAVVA